MQLTPVLDGKKLQSSENQKLRHASMAASREYFVLEKY